MCDVKLSSLHLYRDDYCAVHDSVKNIKEVGNN